MVNIKIVGTERNLDLDVNKVHQISKINDGYEYEKLKKEVLQLLFKKIARIKYKNCFKKSFTLT